MRIAFLIDNFFFWYVLNTFWSFSLVYRSLYYKNTTQSFRILCITIINNSLLTFCYFPAYNWKILLSFVIQLGFSFVIESFDCDIVYKFFSKGNPVIYSFNNFYFLYLSRMLIKTKSLYRVFLLPVVSCLIEALFLFISLKIPITIPNLMIKIIRKGILLVLVFVSRIVFNRKEFVLSYSFCILYSVIEGFIKLF